MFEGWVFEFGGQNLVGRLACTYPIEEIGLRLFERIGGVRFKLTIRKALVFNTIDHISRANIKFIDIPSKLSIRISKITNISNNKIYLKIARLFFIKSFGIC
jgi:hypothetical protein